MSRVVGYLWAAPWTLVGIGSAVVVVLTGGRVTVRAGVVEVAGGAVLPWILRRLPPGGVAAITLGHSVLAIHQEALAETRDHERVHVRQYERWGLFFPVCYGIESVAAAVRGEHYYRDNRFEVEARSLPRRSDPS